MLDIQGFVFVQNTKRNSITITFYLGFQYSSHIKRNFIQIIVHILTIQQGDIKLAHVFRFLKLILQQIYSSDFYQSGWNRFSLYF